MKHRLLLLFLAGALASCSSVENIQSTELELEPEATLLSGYPEHASELVEDSLLPFESEPSAQTITDTLNQVVDDAVASFGGEAGIAVASGDLVWSAGDTTAHPAWSTIKVPISIAALRQNPELYPQVEAAISYSDNAAADVLWQSTNPHLVDEVLAEGKNFISVNTEKVYPEFSAYGQTPWSVEDRAVFASNLPCISGAESVLDLMGNIVESQSYGLGRLAGARFKGGWGPDLNGNYQVSQLGRIPVESGDVSIAITVSPAAGTYEASQEMADMVANGLLPEIDQFSVSDCRERSTL